MMNELDRKFLLAVERGDLNTLKILLQSPNRGLDINCCDPLARNALVIAIDNENLEMVKLLIEAGIRIGDALLYAIHENFVEAVELLLVHEETYVKLGNMHSWEHERENSPFSADMTPLILAAHQNNFEIIKILLDRRVSPMPDPHEPRCDCRNCCLARTQDCLKHSRARINSYRALASPCLMALSSPDPLLTAFEMSAKLENLAKLEPEYKQDYMKLRVQCQTFVTKLLDYARTSKELEILLNYDDEYLDDHDHVDETRELFCQGSLYEMSLRPSSTSMSIDAVYDQISGNPLPRARQPVPPPNIHPTTPSVSNSERKSLRFKSSSYAPNHGKIKPSKKDSILSLDSVTGKHESYKSHMRLARLRLAIQCKQKTFCAHPNIQELLANMWYENLPGFRQKNPLVQIIQVVFIGLMFPLYSIAYLVAPHSQLGRYIKKPFIKFICHSASYMTFILMLILASQRVEAFYSWDSILSLFEHKQDEALITDHGTIIMKKLSFSKSDMDQLNIEELKALYKHYGTIDSANGETSARGLDSLSKIFDQLPASSKKRGCPPSPIELIILIWVLSLIWAEIKQIRALGINYYKSDMWNTLDSVASGFYVITIVLRVISYLQSDENSRDIAREEWDAYDPTLVSEAFFAAATIFSSLKLVYIFSVNPILGPLQTSLARMIIDILRFSWIYLLVLFSFACGMNQLLWYYADVERHQCMNVTNYMLAQYYSSQSEQSNSTKQQQGIPPVIMDDSCKTWRHFSNVFESTQTLFWATFGLVDLENFDLTGIRQYTRFWALLMFGSYCFINVVVVLNLLIAMMNHSYVKISKKSDIEWKFARTRLWMSYFDTGSTVPAPFNIIPSVKSVLMVLTYFTRLGRRESFDGKHLDSLKRERGRINCSLTTSYRNVVRALVRRYLVNEQRLLERKRELTEAKLNRWTRLI